MTDHVLTAPESTFSRLLARLLATSSDLAPVFLRVALAVVMFAHGAQKALGWFGGYGWSGTMGFLTGTIGLPGWAAAGVILLEFLGPVLLLAGLGTRPVALGFAAIMAGAIATVHAPFGFLMNWFGTQQGEGYEFHVLAIGMALALVVSGGGRWSADAGLRRAGAARERGRPR